MKIKNPQTNDLVDRVHQVIYNMLVTKYLDNKVFDYIDTWCETLANIAWSIRVPYHRTLNSTPVQNIFCRDIILKLT